MGKTKKKIYLLVRKSRYKIRIVDRKKIATKTTKRRENNSTITKIFEKIRYKKKKKSKRKRIKIEKKKRSHR